MFNFEQQIPRTGVKHAQYADIVLQTHLTEKCTVSAVTSDDVCAECLCCWFSEFLSLC